MAGSAGLAAFLAVQAKSARPMMPLGLFADRAFATVNAATLLLYAGFGGALFLVPLHLMTVLGFSALAAGAALLPLAVLIALMSRRTGAVVDRWGARLPLTIGPLVTRRRPRPAGPAGAGGDRLGRLGGGLAAGGRGDGGRHGHHRRTADHRGDERRAAVEGRDRVGDQQRAQPRRLPAGDRPARRAGGRRCSAPPCRRRPQRRSGRRC